jgi:hypothetical protein
MSGAAGARRAQILDRLSKSLEPAGKDRHDPFHAAGPFDLIGNPAVLRRT